MANTYNFDGINRVIQLADTGSVDMDVLYSDWKEWKRSGDNGKYAPAFRFVGGDPTVGDNSLGVTYFIINGWKIRPASENHILQVDGNLFRDGGGNPFTPAQGNVNVTVQQQVSNLVDQRVAESPIEDRLDYRGSVFIDTVSGSAGTTHPVGTLATPALNPLEALQIAQTYGLGKAVLLEDIIHPENLNQGFEVEGITNNVKVIFKDTENITDIVYKNLTISGSVSTGSANLFFDDCRFESTTGISGIIKNSTMSGTFSINPDESILQIINCYSTNNLEGQAPVFSFNDDVGSKRVEFRHLTGHFRITNMTHADSQLDIDITSGDIHIESSCTGGTINIRGNCLVFDNSNGSTINIEGNLNPSYMNRLQEKEGVKENSTVTVSKDGRQVDSDNPWSQTFTEQGDGSIIIVRDS